MNGLPVFEFQVAGSHSSSTSNLLRGEFGRVLKPYKVKAVSPLRTSSPDLIQPNKEAYNAENENFDGHEVVCPDERAFYELCALEDVQLRQLRAFLPAFYGETIVYTAGCPTRYLVLEDLTARCELPCVADLKMGVSRHYPGKPHRKLRADKEKYPSLRDTGWCIAGLLQHAPHGPLLDKFGPATGRTFSTQQVHARMTTFIGGTRGSAKRRQLVREITSVLEEIQKWFGSQRRFWFRSSSILVVYNAEYFLEAPADNSGNYSHSEVEVRRSVSSQKGVNFLSNVSSTDQTHSLDVAQTGRSCEGENDEVDETVSDKKSVLEISESASSLHPIEIFCVGDQASIANETSTMSQRDEATSKLRRSDPQSPTFGDNSYSEDHARETESITGSGSTAETIHKPQTSSVSGTIDKTGENTESSCASGILNNAVQQKPDLSELVDQRSESIQKKMKKLESSSSSSCLNHKMSVSDLNSNALVVVVKMIDFAHVLEAGGEPDSGYITGLNNLLHFIQSIV
ncbi:Inositol polyphosphate kinase [Trinorchestia longiramus]|nr:Inositol polyphosphate kinase [Trinorchestia longiramus]